MAKRLTLRISRVPWKHSGFNVHTGDPVPPEAKASLE
jgi:hypothetical protein